MLVIHPVLDRRWPAHGMGPIAAILAQLPAPAELAPGTRVAVYAGLPLSRARRWLNWLWPARRAHVAVRCTALLAQGFQDVEATADDSGNGAIAYGTAPR